MSLISLAASIGLPVIEKIISKQFGGGAGELGGMVLDEVARRVGVPVDELDHAAEASPDAVGAALRDVEAKSPELIALYASGIELQRVALESEREEPLWMRAWRPGGMYMIGLLWIWNVIILHVANAIWKTALPPMPFEQLIHLSGLYMGLYMGGHTIKDAVGKWAGSK